MADNIMSNDGFNILIDAQIDEALSKQKIIGQLKKMQQSLAVDIHMRIDPELQKSIQSFSRQMERISDASLKQLNVTKEVVQINKELDGTIQKISQKYIGELKVNEEIITTIDKKKKKTQELLVLKDKESETDKKRLKDLDNLGKKLQEVTRLDENLNVVGQTKYYRQQGTKTGVVQVNTDADGYVTSAKVVDSIQKEEAETRKLVKAKEELRRKLLELKQVGQISAETMKSVGNALNATKSEEGVAKLTARIKELQAVSKQMINMDALQYQNAQKEKEKNDAIAHRIKLYQQEMAIKLQDTKTRFGSTMSAGDTQGLEELRKKMLALSAVTPHLDREIKQLNADLKQLQANARQNGLNSAAKDAQSFGDMLKNAMVKFPVWMVASTAFFQSVRFFSEGIKYVNDLNKALTEISIVTGKSQAQVDALGKEYHKLAMQMGVTTKEIATASVEFYRQGLSQAEVMDKMKVATQYAKISAIDFNASAKILTATVNSMGVDVTRASDVFAYLGDATATGADEIGIAFQKVGGSTGALGIEFEKMSSWIATVSSRTREGAETIGDAFKSITARIQSLRERGFAEEDGTQYNQVAKALNEVGIALTDNQGQFRNFGIVMDELGKKWSSLDSKHKAYLATTVAGTYQQGRFFNLMEGYEESLKLYDQALQAAGTTQQKFNLYQQSTEASLNRLKTAYTGLWSNTFDSQGLRDIIDMLTKFVETITLVVEKFGAFPVIFGTAGTALALFSTRFRTAAIEMITFKKATDGTLISVTALKNGIRLLAASTGVGLVLLGLSFVLEKLVGNFMNAGREAENFNNQLQQTHQEAKQNTTELEELSKKYAELERASDGSTESQDKLKAVRQQISDIMPQTLKYYDEEGKAVYATAEEVKGLVEEYKRLNVERAKSIADTTLENTKKNAKELKSLYKDQNSLQRDFDDAKAREEATKFVGVFLEQNKEVLEDADKFSEEYSQKMAELHKGIQDIFNQHGSMTNEVGWTTSLMFDIGRNGGITKSLEQATNETGLAKQALEKNQADIKAQLEGFVTHFKATNEVVVDQFGVTNKNVKILLDTYANDFTESNKITSKNQAEMVALYKEHAGKMAEVISDLEKNGKINIENLFEVGNLETLKEKLLSLNIPITTVDRYITELQNKIKATPKFTLDLTRITNDLTKSFKDTSNAVAPLNKLLGDLADGKRISANEALDLIEKEEKLIDAIKFENGILSINQQAVRDVRDEKIQSYKDAIIAKENEVKAQADLLFQELENYGIQIQAIEEVGRAKNELANKQKASNNELMKSMQMGGFGLGSVTATMAWALDKQKIDDTITEIDNITAAYDRVQKYKDLINSGGLSTPSSSRSGKTKAEESKAEAFAAQDVTAELIKSFNAEYQISKQKEKNLNLAVKTADRQKDYNKAIKLTNDLLNLQAKKAEQLREANKKIHEEANDVRKRNSLGLSTAQIDSWFDVNGEATIKYKEYLNSFAKESEAIVNNSKLSEKTKKEKIAHLADQQKAVEKLFDSIYRLKQAYGANATELQALDGIIDSLKTDIEGFQAKIDKIRDDTEKAAQKAHDKWVSQTKKAVSEAQKAIKDYYNKAKEVAINAIQAQIDAEEDRHKKVIENKDKELQKYQETVDAILKLHDRNAQEEDYQASVMEQTNNINALKAERAKLALIDTPEAKAQREELDKQIQEAEKNLNKFKLDRQRETTKQGLEDLKEAKQKEIDAAKASENKKYEAEKERLDKLKKETQDFWQAKIEDDRFFLQIEQDIFNGNVESVKSKMREMGIDVTSNMQSLGEGIRTNLINTLEDALVLLDQVKYGSASIGGSLTGDDYSKFLESNRGTPIWDIATGDKEELTGYQKNLMKASSDSSFARSEIMRSFDVYATKGQTWEKQKGAIDWAKQMLQFVDAASIGEMKAQFDGATVLNKLTSKASGWEQLAKDELKRSSLVYFIKTALGDTVGAADAHKWAERIRSISGIQSFDTGGYTGEFQGGKLALLHEKEYVLNQKNFDAVLSSIELANKLIGNLTTPSSIYRNAGVNTNSPSNIISIENLMHIDKVENASEMDIKKLVRDGLDELLHTLGGYGFTLN